MARDDREWEYHQDSRDDALTIGCFTVVAVILCGIVLAIAAIVG